MKTLLSALVILSFSLSFAEDPVPGFFQGTVKEVYEAGKVKNQVIMIDFFTDWCGPCKMLDAQIYRSAEFLPYTKKMVAYNIDAEKGEGIELAEKYGVKVYPSIIFINSDGNELERIIGFRGKEQFLKDADRILEGKDIFSVWKESNEKKPTIENTGKLAKYFLSFDAEKAKPYGDLLTKLDPDLKSELSREIKAGVASNKMRRAKREDKNPEAELAELVNNYPSDAWAVDAASNLANFYTWRLNDNEKGWAIYSKMLANQSSEKQKELEDRTLSMKIMTKKLSKEEGLSVLNTCKPENTQELMQAVSVFSLYPDPVKMDGFFKVWLDKNGETASLDEINNIGFTAFENKVQIKPFLKVILSAWNKASETEKSSYIADTIANLACEAGDKKTAVTFGKYAVEKTDTADQNYNEFKASLERYESMK